MDLIDRQAAIDHWRLIIDATSMDSRYNMGFVDGLEFCINHLSTMPAVQPQPEEDCDTCKHGFFGSRQCDNCRVRYPSHYERDEERRTDE